MNNNYIFIILFAVILIISGLFFKLGLVPFHYWIADVYEGSSLIITYFFSVIPKISILIILMRAFPFIFHPDCALEDISIVLMPIIILTAIISITIGSIGALYQIQIKRLLAYSAIVNRGYILLGLRVTSLSGIFASFYYLFIHIIMTVNIFIILMYVRRYPMKLKLKNLIEFVSVSHSNFLLSLLLVLALLSFAGIPPLSGSFGKFSIFTALIFKGHYLLALYAVLFSVLTSIYYIRLVRFI